MSPFNRRAVLGAAVAGVAAVFIPDGGVPEPVKVEQVGMAWSGADFAIASEDYTVLTMMDLHTGLTKMIATIEETHLLENLRRVSAHSADLSGAFHKLQESWTTRQGWKL